MRHRAGRRRGQQDLVERGIWGERTDVPGGGSIMSVRGTGTVDFELPVVNFGYSFNLPSNSDAEVMMVNLGNDPNDKVALPVIPRQFQYQWAEGQGGVQHPTDPERRIEFNDDETFLRDGTFVVGSNREVTITVDGTNVTIQTGGNMIIAAPNVDIQSVTLTHNGTNIGDNHTHGGVDTGGGNTAGPN